MAFMISDWRPTDLNHNHNVEGVEWSGSLLALTTACQ